MSRPSKKIHEETPIVQKSNNLKQQIIDQIQAQWQGLGQFYVAQELRSFINSLYDNAKEAFVNAHADNIAKVNEGEKHIIAADGAYSIILAVANGATKVDPTKLVNELHKREGKKLTQALIEEAVDAATVKQAGAKRFNAVIGSG